MSKNTYAMMPHEDYVAACDAIREQTGTEDLIKSGDMSNMIRSIEGGGGASDAVRYNTVQNLTDEQKAQARKNIGVEIPYITPEMYGAKGDGTTDDTTVFQNALANNRVVFVPGGTYKLSGELVIKDNCQMELAQDVVLNFTQTSGNCITINRSSYLKGNHATVNVPYGFVGNVINADSGVHTAVKDVPPFTHWTPQWKTARYLTDVNICMEGSGGIHQSTDGQSFGTAVYISANRQGTGEAKSSFIWGLNFSGLRIAGAFEYGIRAQNYDEDTYNHEMRIEAFMDGCKIGVSLEDCNKAYISAIIQPRKAADGTVYAKHGIQLIRSKDTELSGSRVWDWNESNSLWTYDKSNANQHIAMYGNCRGTILNDFLYYHVPSGFEDLRELIYTDTPANFDSLIILQEPFTRWFKPTNKEPYFYNGYSEKRLCYKEELDSNFQTYSVPNFTDVLSKATDSKGAIYNEIGYKKGLRVNENGEIENNYIASTGYIACTPSTTRKIRTERLRINGDDGYNSIVFYDENFNYLGFFSGINLTTSSYFKYALYGDDGCEFILYPMGTWKEGAKYFRLSVSLTHLKDNPVISIDEEITYSQEGFLNDGVFVKEQCVYGLEDKYERLGRMTNAISSASTDDQYPSAKAVYTAIQDFLGVVENGTY